MISYDRPYRKNLFSYTWFRLLKSFIQSIFLIWIHYKSNIFWVKCRKKNMQAVEEIEKSFMNISECIDVSRIRLERHRRSDFDATYKIIVEFWILLYFMHHFLINPLGKCYVRIYRANISSRNRKPEIPQQLNGNPTSIQHFRRAITKLCNKKLQLEIEKFTILKLI